ncbi:TMV resistance protein N-like [Bidens hawaiensis]|uniref:TMV resistance protein N-like n=1 Tax=Bidens hawaiensis TaxID=980011 RepID=UPI00404A95CE
MLLNRRESLNLFTRLMFVGDSHVNPKFIKEVVSRAGGLPLVLKVWSSHFKQYEREQWPNILETLKGIPHGDVQKQLKLSYDSLTPRLKKLFLDIACFFDVDDETDDKDLVVKVFEDEDSRFFPNNEIKYLVDKSLVEITSDSKLWMHHAIREMGLEIVRQENEDEPGQRTRLWDQRDVMRVLTECSGTESVESISVTLLKDTHDVTLNAFGKMSNLRLIYVWIDGYAHSLSFHDETTHLCFKKLKCMHWFHFPFKSLDNFDMCNVVVLTMTESRLETLWEGIKSLKKLRVLDVRNSYSLTKTGNLSGLENLEELYFHDCVNLKSCTALLAIFKNLLSWI